MLELKKLAIVLSGVSVREAENGNARFVRLSDLSDIKADRKPKLAVGKLPAVARALTIKEGDLIVGARGSGTDVCVANEDLLGAFVSLDLYLIRPNPELVNSQYLAFSLELPTTQALFAASKQGTGLARLPKPELERAKIPVPSLHMQQMIAGLALAFRQESNLLRQLADLKLTLGRNVLMSTIRAENKQHNTKRTSK
jgi:hypothetical protein